MVFSSTGGAAGGMGNYQFLKVKSEGGTATITLNRPPLNVLTIAMMEELVSALQWAASEPGGLIVLDAEGKAFSAGVDVADHTEDKVDHMIDVFDRVFLAMAGTDKAIVAAVNGAALGGGCELALFCDLVVASDRAKFGQPEISVGVFPPVACWLLPRLVSWPRALDLLLSGEVISAQRADQIGLVNRVIPGESFRDGVKEFLQKFSAQSPVVLALTKKAARTGLGWDFAGGIKEIDAIYLRDLMKTRDAHEGLKAFMEKRLPVWQGK